MLCHAWYLQWQITENQFLSLEATALHVPVPTELSNPVPPKCLTLKKDHPIHCSSGIRLAHLEAPAEAIQLPEMFFALCTLNLICH